MNMPRGTGPVPPQRLQRPRPSSRCRSGLCRNRARRGARTARGLERVDWSSARRTANTSRRRASVRHRLREREPQRARCLVGRSWRCRDLSRPVPARRHLPTPDLQLPTPTAPAEAEGAKLEPRSLARTRIRVPLREELDRCAYCPASPRPSCSAACSPPPRLPPRRSTRACCASRPSRRRDCVRLRGDIWVAPKQGRRRGAPQLAARRGVVPALLAGPQDAGLCPPTTTANRVDTVPGRAASRRAHLASDDRSRARLAPVHTGAVRVVPRERP